MSARKPQVTPMSVGAKRSSRRSDRRTLNALAIASRQTTDGHRASSKRRARSSPRENRHTSNLHHESSFAASHGQERARQDEPEQWDEDVERGSDSDGNEWRLGDVGSQEDSEIDSDEALGESDIEKFEGFAFGGSARGKSRKLERRSVKLSAGHTETGHAEDSDLNDSGQGEGEVWSGLEEDGVLDLTTLLDETEPDARRTQKRSHASSPDFGSGTDDSDSDHETQSILSISDEGLEHNGPEKLSALQGLIQSVNPDVSGPPAKRRRMSNGHDSGAPSDFGITSARKLTVDDLLPSVTDADMKRSLRLIASTRSSKQSDKQSGIPDKLNPPLARRQQDRLDRAAAYAKSKETLDRWIDTIKHNRRAEHLSFPLTARGLVTSHGGNHVLPRGSTTLPNELEATVQDILLQSGLEVPNGSTEERQIQKLEELQTKDMSLEEVQARRAELRMARELLFREEVRAKRIKKIKSKTYRRVHRKERERAHQETQAALLAGGLIASEDEREINDRRRAEERMGARHRESRWAKEVKASGRAKWDQDARSGFEEMASREEALKRRIEGKSTRSREDGDDTSSQELSDSDGSDDDGRGNGTEVLLRQLHDLDGQRPITGKGQSGHSKLSSMKFMQRADAARKMENDVAVLQLKRELVGEESPEEEPVEQGRRKYQPKTRDSSKTIPPGATKPNELEERLSHEDDSDEGGAVIDTGSKPSLEANTIARPHAQTRGRSTAKGLLFESSRNDKTSSRITSEKNVRAPKADHTVQQQVPAEAAPAANPLGGFTSDKANSTSVRPASSSVPRESEPQSNPSRWKSAITNGGDISSENEELELDEVQTTSLSLTQDELRLRAFAGDEVERSFEAEKAEIIKDEDDQVIDNTLPGWGHWIGDGISKKAQARHKGKFLTKIEGVKKEKRADAKLNHVIISEKRIKKNSKYLASSLPHPFENRQQYERSLRIPMGPEWTTKETFQTATKPRVLLKQGIIAPMQRPLL